MYNRLETKIWTTKLRFEHDYKQWKNTFSYNKLLVLLTNLKFKTLQIKQLQPTITLEYRKFKLRFEIKVLFQRKT